MPQAEAPVVVTRELRALIPTFLANRRKDLDALRDALATEDFARLREIGHRLKGVGACYGFEAISAIGRRIESEARTCDRAALAAQVEAYAAHLARVRITYE